MCDDATMSVQEGTECMMFAVKQSGLVQLDPDSMLVISSNHML